MKIKQKIITGFLVLSLLVGLVGIIGIYTDNLIAESFENAEGHFGSIIEASNEVSSYAKRAEGHAMLYLTFNNESDKKKFSQRISSLREEISIIETNISNPLAKNITVGIKTKTDELQSIGESLFVAHDNALKASGRFEFSDHEKSIRRLDDVAAEIRRDGLELAKLEIRLQQEMNDNAKENAINIQIIVFFTGLIAVICSLIFGYGISRSISNPILKLKDAAEEIGKGKLNTNLDISSNDEIGILASTFNRMVKDLGKEISLRQGIVDELQQRNDFVKTILESLPYPFYVIDAGDHTISLANSAAYTGGREEAITCHALFHKGTKPCAGSQHPCPLEEVKITRKPAIVEHIHYDKEGNPRNVEVHCYPIFDSNGNVVRAIEYSLDITERKRIEEVLRENESLARASRAKSEFLTTMSHELRTPLNSIIGFSELLKQKSPGELNGKQLRYVENVLTGGNNLLRLIDDILDLSRVEAGNIDLEIEKVSVQAVIDESLSLIKEKAGSHNIILKKELDPELDLVEVDKQRVKQILFNLLNNAIKFSKPEGGTVTITTRKEGDMAKISVSDTGIGIKEEEMGRLFKEFEQLDSGTARKYGGTGLGLVISKKLVELQGGKIWAESKYGEGSTFTFTLPLTARNGNESDGKCA